MLHVIGSGKRVTELAAELGGTKQGLTQTVGVLIERGYAQRSPDPADGRAKVMTLTDRGGMRARPHCISPARSTGRGRRCSAPKDWTPSGPDWWRPSSRPGAPIADGRRRNPTSGGPYLFRIPPPPRERWSRREPPSPKESHSGNVDPTNLGDANATSNSVDRIRFGGTSDKMWHSLPLPKVGGTRAWSDPSVGVVR